MGLTVACARCHDHKYDPIPTADYYSLYGVFQNCAERFVPHCRARASKCEPAITESTAFERNSGGGSRKFQHATNRGAGSKPTERARRRVADYLLAQLELDKNPEERFNQMLTTSNYSRLRPQMAGVSRGCRQIGRSVFYPLASVRAD